MQPTKPAAIVALGGVVPIGTRDVLGDHIWRTSHLNNSYSAANGSASLIMRLPDNTIVDVCTITNRYRLRTSSQPIMPLHVVPELDLCVFPVMGEPDPVRYPFYFDSKSITGSSGNKYPYDVGITTNTPWSVVFDTSSKAKQLRVVKVTPDVENSSRRYAMKHSNLWLGNTRKPLRERAIPILCGCLVIDMAYKPVGFYAIDMLSEDPLAYVVPITAICKLLESRYTMYAMDASLKEISLCSMLEDHLPSADCFVDDAGKICIYKGINEGDAFNIHALPTIHDLTCEPFRHFGVVPPSTSISVFDSSSTVSGNKTISHRYTIFPPLFIVESTSTKQMYCYQCSMDISLNNRDVRETTFWSAAASSSTKFIPIKSITSAIHPEPLDFNDLVNLVQVSTDIFRDMASLPQTTQSQITALEKVIRFNLATGSSYITVPYKTMILARELGIMHALGVEYPFPFDV